MFAALAREWELRGFVPEAVFIEAGPWWSWRRTLSRVRPRGDDSAGVCRRLGWPHISVAAINDASTVDALSVIAPDIAINAGGGILRRPVLAVPRVGTVGAHMGLLPGYRGMNVAEWAAFNGDPVGCTVFFIDEGIDTGGIIATCDVDITGCPTVDALRARVNDAQVSLLADTSMAIVNGGLQTAARSQFAAEGRQFYRMHGDLRSILERRLARSS